MTNLVIIQRVLPHYRVPFFRKLEECLSHEGIKLKLIYGQENPGTVPRSVDINDDWAVKIKNSYICVGKTELVWQPCYKLLNDCDLIIIEQANRLLLNYILQFWWRKSDKKLAFWGHGQNMQGDSTSIREKFKTTNMSKVDWWFAYTQKSYQRIIENKFPSNKITVVNNSIDTKQLRADADAISTSQVNSLKTELGLSSSNIGLYCGGMYPDKMLPFLIDACREIKKSVDNFEMVFIGSGPDEYLVKQVLEENPWIKFVGAKYGKERVPYFMMSEALLMPGLVGLAIIDSFVAGVPIFTTDIPRHSPEISYLESGKNGIMTAHDVKEYADSVAHYLHSQKDKDTLIAGCKESAELLTLDNMIYNFLSGVRSCLEIAG